MKISGFTMIRNGEIMGYPYLESISSLLPLVDEFVIAVGHSTDTTREKICGLGSSKIRIVDTVWDLSKTNGGIILSEKTNEALSYCQNEWCFYLQSDEVLHENDLNSIEDQLRKFESYRSVQGLLFDFIHFYGSYAIIGHSRKWYRHEIRAIKKSSNAQSYKDAQGFRCQGQKLKVVKCFIPIYHYGWVKPPKDMGIKIKELDRWWHGNTRMMEYEAFEFRSEYGLRTFKGTHPLVMKDRIAQQHCTFTPRRGLRDWRAKEIRYWLSDVFESIFNYRLGEYKPYVVIHEDEER